MITRSSKIEELGIRAISFLKALFHCGSIRLSQGRASVACEKELYAKQISDRIGIDVDYDTIIGVAISLERKLPKAPIMVCGNGSIILYDLMAVIIEIENRPEEKVNWKLGF